MTRCEKCGLEKPNKGFVCPQRSCPRGLGGTGRPSYRAFDHDDENIYGLASMRQSVEEDRAKRGR